MQKTVLVVDDDRTVLELYSAFFESKGYHVITVPNGRRALDTLASQKVDLMILDLAMPEMDGEQVMESMSEHPDWKKIPIVVDTALGSETGRPAKLKERFSGKLQYVFFQRPSSLESISDAIHKILVL